MNDLRPKRTIFFLATFSVVLVGLAIFLFIGGGGEPEGIDTPNISGGNAAIPLTGNAQPTTPATPKAGDERHLVVEEPAGSGIVEGRVFSLNDGSVVVGTQVIAVKRFPAATGLESLFRNMFRNGLWTANPRPPLQEIVGRAQTDGAGAFKLVGLPAGRIWLDLGEGYYYAHRFPSLRLSANGHRQGIRIAAAKGGMVRGMIRDSRGNPVVGATLDLRPGFNSFLGHFTGQGYRWRMGRSDAKGHFVLSGVPQGNEYVLSAFGPKFPIGLKGDLEVAVGQTLTVDLSGQSGCSISGVVNDLEGNPLAGAKVALALMDLHLILFSPEACPPVITGPDGSFRLDNIPPGPVVVAAAISGESISEREELNLKAGEAVTGLVLEVGGGKGLSGKVVDHQGQPVAGVLVEALNGERNRSLDMGQFLTFRRAQAKSDKEGRFALRGLAGNRIFVKASRDGYATKVMPRVKLGAKDLEIKLQPLARVVGIVVDKRASKPVKNFTVELRGFFGMDRQRKRWEFSSDKGKFSIPDAPAGKARLQFRSEGYVEQTKTVEVKADTGAAGVIVLLEPESVIGGQVVAANGAPVPGATVFAFRNRSPFGGEFNFDFGRGRGGRRGGPMGRGGGGNNPMRMMMGGSGPGRAVAGPDGSFLVTGLGAGKWKLMAIHPAHARSQPEEVETSPETPAQGVTLRLTKGGVIHGYVTGLDGQPVVHAVVVAASMKGAFRSGTTDKKGYYRLEHMIPGSYFIFKSRVQGRTTWNLAAALLNNLRLKTVRLKGEDEVRFDITDRVAAGVDVTGVVRRGGELVPECLVTALTAEGDGPLGIGVRSTISDKKGRYKLSSLLPGSYIFQIAVMRSRPSTVPVEIPEGVSAIKKDLDLPVSHIKGVVTDPQGKPVVGARVRAVPKGSFGGGGLLTMLITRGAWRTSTKANGEFSLSRVPAGFYKLEVDAPRKRKDLGATTLEQVNVDGTNDVTGLSLILPAAALIKGVVRDGKGEPVVGANVRAQRVGSLEDVPENLKGLGALSAPRTKTDREGNFLLAGLAPGTWNVTAEKEGSAPGQELGVVLSQGEEKELALALCQGGTVKVKVVNEAGQRVPNIKVKVLNEQGKNVSGVVSAAQIFRKLWGRKKDNSGKEGWTTFKNVRPGKYTVVTSTTGGEEKDRRPLLVKEGETSEFELVLKD